VYYNIFALLQHCKTLQGYSNPEEAQAVLDVALALPVQYTSVKIITFYKMQLLELKKQLELRYDVSQHQRIHICTVDSCQVNIHIRELLYRRTVSISAHA
jgi:AAA domain